MESVCQFQECLRAADSNATVWHQYLLSYTRRTIEVCGSLLATSLSFESVATSNNALDNRFMFLCEDLLANS